MIEKKSILIVYIGIISIVIIPIVFLPLVVLVPFLCYCKIMANTPSVLRPSTIDTSTRYRVPTDENAALSLIPPTREGSRTPVVKGGDIVLSGANNTQCVALSASSPFRGPKEPMYHVTSPTYDICNSCGIRDLQVT